MLKNILKLEGAQELSKSEQKTIKGALVKLTPSIDCWCGSTYVGTCWSVSCCITTCTMY